MTPINWILYALSWSAGPLAIAHVLIASMDDPNARTLPGFALGLAWGIGWYFLFLMRRGE